MTAADNMDHLLTTLKYKSELAVKSFKDNQMVVSLDKFQITISQNSRNSKNYQPVKLEIGSAKIETKNTVKLLETTIDNKLNFERTYIWIMQKKPLYTIKYNKSFTNIYG